MFVQLLPRARIPMNAPLLVRDVAKLSPARDSLLNLPLLCPDTQGIWNLSAIVVLDRLQSAAPEETFTLLAGETCRVHRIGPMPGKISLALRTAAVCAILFCGSALGMAWFHSDVDMPHAMVQVFTALTGAAPPGDIWITLPYCLGVALGVWVFYALPSRRATTPLDVKMSSYQQDMEQTEGREMP